MQQIATALHFGGRLYDAHAEYDSGQSRRSGATGATSCPSRKHPRQTSELRQMNDVIKRNTGVATAT